MKMELTQREEAKLDAFAASFSKVTYWVVILVCLLFLIMFVSIFFGDYVGLIYRDQDVVEWCEEYHPNWVYEQCESMVGR